MGPFTVGEGISRSAKGYSNRNTLAKKAWSILVATLIFCLPPRLAAADSLSDLFAGDSYQADDLLFSNWELVEAKNVNVDDIYIGAGYGGTDDAFGVWAKNRELRVARGSWGTPKTLRLKYDFLVTGINVDIAKATAILGFRSVSGFYYDTPWIKGKIDVGTSKGGKNLGSATGVFSLNEDTTAPWVKMPSGIDQIWVRHTISLYSGGKGFAEAGYASNSVGPALCARFKTKPKAFGNAITIPENIEFALEQYATEEFEIQLTNPGEISQLVALEVVNPHSGLVVSLDSLDSIALGPGEEIDVPVVIDACTMPAGIYNDILLKLTTENGETLYSNITVAITDQDLEAFPDLSLRTEDIQLVDYTIDNSATLQAVIHNKGLSPASNVQVQFYEFDSLIGEIVLQDVPAEGFASADITAPITTSGEHLIRVVIDAEQAIDELDETDNEACRIVEIGSSATRSGNIIVSGSLPAKVYAGNLFTASGRAAYDVYVDGVRYTDYAVKGGSVEITIKDGNDNEWIYGGIHTNTDGDFIKYLQAPATIGKYRLFMTVTDQTFTGTRELVFEVVEKPVAPQPPPPPATVTGSGYWTYDPLSDTWNWTWTSPPENEPVTQDDLRVFSENIHFSENNPGPDEEITIFTEILYWATDSCMVAESVPVNLYVTYPGEPKEKFGTAFIPSLSVGSPDFGSMYVYGTWKNKGEGIYIVETEIDPDYTEENMLNNAATRAIIVGDIPSDHGGIQGQATSPRGSVSGATIELYDSSMTSLIASTATDSFGHYLFDGLPVGDYQVHIITPDGYTADAETKPAGVVDQSIATVNFSLNTVAIYLCGDLDYDKDVDGDDRNILRGAFYTTAEDPGFVAEADYDMDGDIDYSDYQLWYACYKAFIE